MFLKSRLLQLGWWKSNLVKYLILSQISKHVLAMPISMVASESVFSIGGRIYTPNVNDTPLNGVELQALVENLEKLEVEELSSREKHHEQLDDDW
ncbi:hypothetical protein OSB04_001677 [Centaurea solstitialis]|uniref:HAT C-terminal dimerisation domain-containing protein n=1 Tax=Centaurea solstitialis TaxID=347529 RepID=A0AA38U424_9ASTR|nr:hypothetical protein OSB04_001677 [Centaurea solstitialis]